MAPSRRPKAKGPPKVQRPLIPRPPASVPHGGEKGPAFSLETPAKHTIAPGPSQLKRPARAQVNKRTQQAFSRKSKTSTALNYAELGHSSTHGGNDHDVSSQSTDATPEVSYGYSTASSDSEDRSDDDDDIVQPLAKRRKTAPLTPGNYSPISDVEEPQLIIAKPSGKTLGNWVHKLGIKLDEAPMHDISKIFADMAQKALGAGFEDVLESLGNRKLRVATMCSGTEAPILFLNELSAILKSNHQIQFEIDHVFSAEIVSFKQAYIERNFHPPILFRDIRQLHEKDRADTAYGAPVAVPGDVDMLIAGFSCVDFSRLNNAGKSLDEIGESSDTLGAIIKYADKHRTPLVVLENVLTAPWSKIVEMWEHIGYSALWIKVDTKQYYIPHTRQRGYLICIERRNTVDFSTKEAVKEWAAKMKDFERPATSPVTSFLFGPDDLRLHLAIEELTKSLTGEEKVIREVSWVKCQQRHLYYRSSNRLGNHRPVTGWQENGPSRMVDFGNHEWAGIQVDRVKDTLDMAYLRNAYRGYDHEFKTRVLDLSQNIDRFVDSAAFGLTPCLTPMGQPYLTTRGGPIVGAESLMLQGIPVDKLHLTCETQRELQDLAGNAMSSTAVGAAILSALLVGHQALPKRKETTPRVIPPSLPHLQEVDVKHLKERSIDFGSYKDTIISDLQTEAKRSARRCHCEGQFTVTSRRLFVCKACSHSSCEKCYGSPLHEYVETKESTVKSRIPPHIFVDRIKKALPMRLRLQHLTADSFETAKTLYQDIISKPQWEAFFGALFPAFEEELRFHSVHRCGAWTVKYESLHSRLELVFKGDKPRWFWYAKAKESEPIGSTTRRLLRQPVARMSVEKNNILAGVWEIRIPTSLTFVLAVEGKEPLVPSWKSRLGLVNYKDEKVWSRLRLSYLRAISEQCNVDIIGDYILLPECGTACGSLHRRASNDSTEGLYLLLDPDQIGDTSKDDFVFTSDIRRLVNGEVRHVNASIGPLHEPCKRNTHDGKDKPNWRPSGDYNRQEVECTVHEQWTRCDAFLSIVIGKEAIYAVPTDDILLSISAGIADVQWRNEKDQEVCHCQLALTAILSCKVPLEEDENIGWPTEGWAFVDQGNEAQRFATFSWLMERIKDLGGFPDRWRSVSLPYTHTHCQMCAPKKPEIRWRREEAHNNIKQIPYEDPQQAGPYECAVKARPSPFIVQFQVDRSNNGRLIIALNIQTLIHQTLGFFPELTSYEGTEVTWRLSTQHVLQAWNPLPEFVLSNNKTDRHKPHTFLGKFDDGTPFSLRPEQERSLSWMIAQEDEEASPFYEQEIQEACLTSLGWRAEARVRRAHHVRGGVLADEVGYGKTIITLALIDYQNRINNTGLKEPRPGSKVKRKSTADKTLPEHGLVGRVPLKGTLILVPTTLIPQWQKQAKKFLSRNYSILVIKTIAQLTHLAISDFESADVIIAPWTILTSESYLRRLSQFAALPEAPPTLQGRAFAAWLITAVNNAAKHMQELQALPFPVDFAETLKQRLYMKEDDDRLPFQAPSKRLRGKRYVAANECKDAGTGSASNDSPDSKVRYGTKRKAGAKAKLADTAARETSQDDKDNFGLRQAKCAKDVRGLPFEVFFFDRIVLDEFTYTSSKDAASITSLKAASRWILSGTPSLGDFADVKILAAFLRINLGMDDASRGYSSSHNIKAITKDRTAAEQFQSYNQVFSPVWHEQRHTLAQQFLDQFVRQNIAEIDEIPTREKLIGVTLPAADYVAYLELHMKLCSHNMKIPKGTRSKGENDRSQRLDELLESSNTAEEALLKRCSMSINDDLKSISIDCKTIERTRRDQFDDTRTKLNTGLFKAAAMKKYLKEHAKHYDRWSHNIKHGTCGDEEVRTTLNIMIIDADRDASSEVTRNEATIPALRDTVASLHALVGEYVYKKRALRFIQKISYKKDRRNGAHLDCGHDIDDANDVSILVHCGHDICRRCRGSVGLRTQCPVTGCDAPMMEYHTLKSTDLSQDRDAQTRSHYGKKIDDIVRLVENDIPSGEQALLFVQFDDLMEKIAKAFKDHSVSHYAIRENLSNNKAADMMENFQEDMTSKKRKVLLLNCSNESSAGANLTNANHVIFVSPLLAQSQREYDAWNTQCIGRARRFGQTKAVYLYRFMALKTIDVDIIQECTSKKLIKTSEGVLHLKTGKEMTKFERDIEYSSGMPSRLFSSGSDEE